MQLENLSFYSLSNKELGKKSGIYKLSAGGHIYIGSSKNLYSRLTEHKVDLYNNKHSNEFLQRVSNKYGVENIRVDIIEFCEPDVRLEREKFWIDTLKADMNMQDPVDHALSEESKQKLSESVKSGRKQGKYKTKFDFCEVECYDYFGNYITTYKDKEEAALKLGISKKDVQRLASGYKKGTTNGVRLRYSNSTVPVQKFPVNPQYIGKYYDFYYIDNEGKEKLAFTNLKDCWLFLGTHSDSEKITLIPKLKIKLRESGNVLKEENPNPSTIEI